MPKKVLKSNCCNAPIDTVSDDEGTSFYRCTYCCFSCDPKSRVRRVKPLVEPQIATDEEAKQFADHLDSVASFKRSGVKDLENANFFWGTPTGKTLGKGSEDRPCPEGCKGDDKHLHVKYGQASTSPNPPQISKWHARFRRLMLVVIGALLVLSYQKFMFNVCSKAAIETVDKLFLRR